MSARSPIVLPDGLAAADDADDAGAADAGDHLVAAELAQLVGDDAGGAVHLVEQLGVLVEIMAPGRHFIGEGGDAIDDGHGGLLSVLLENLSNPQGGFVS